MSKIGINLTSQVKQAWEFSIVYNARIRLPFYKPASKNLSAACLRDIIQSTHKMSTTDFNNGFQSYLSRSRISYCEVHYDNKFIFPVPLYLQSRSTYL